MTVILGLLAVIGVALVGAVANDLLSDAPRLASRITRFMVRLLPPNERDFFAWEAEIQVAATDAVAGARSRTSVLLMSVGFGLTVVARRFRHRSAPLPTPSPPPIPDNYVKIWLPVPPDLDLGGYTIWAEDLGDGLYKVMNHPVFSDVACADDIVRCHEVIERHEFDGRVDEFVRLEFVEVVSEAARPEFHVWREPRWQLMGRAGAAASASWSSLARVGCRHRPTRGIINFLTKARRGTRRVIYWRRHRLWSDLNSSGASLTFVDVDYFKGWLPAPEDRFDEALEKLSRLGFAVEQAERSFD